MVCSDQCVWSQNVKFQERALDIIYGGSTFTSRSHESFSDKLDITLLPAAKIDVHNCLNCAFFCVFNYVKSTKIG